jgi:asparagine N-glycosylation enzyme membrane subunit Stt3
MADSTAKISGDGSVSTNYKAITTTIRLILTLALLYISLTETSSLLTTAYTIRLHAIETYGYIIHEFDPYFNFRAAQYLYDNGWQKFCTWFDYMSW